MLVRNQRSFGSIEAAHFIHHRLWRFGRFDLSISKKHSNPTPPRSFEEAPVPHLTLDIRNAWQSRASIQRLAAWIATIKPPIEIVGTPPLHWCRIPPCFYTFHHLRILLRSRHRVYRIFLPGEKHHSRSTYRYSIEYLHERVANRWAAITWSQKLQEEKHRKLLFLLPVPTLHKRRFVSRVHVAVSGSSVRIGEEGGTLRNAGNQPRINGRRRRSNWKELQQQHSFWWWWHDSSSATIWGTIEADSAAIQPEVDVFVWRLERLCSCFQ